MAEFKAQDYTACVLYPTTNFGHQHSFILYIVKLMLFSANQTSMVPESLMKHECFGLLCYPKDRNHGRLVMMPKNQDSLPHLRTH